MQTNKRDESENTTDFGYQSVAWHEKEQMVQQVFASVANKYDIMNDFMSFGIHRIWKRIAILLGAVRPGHNVLDLASGSGDLAKLIMQHMKGQGTLVLSDLNANMLSVGRNNIIDHVAFNPSIKFIQANAQQLPFQSNYFNLVTIGFGLRNVTDKSQALKEIYRVCRPGGRIIVLEFSEPTSKMLKAFYDWYSFNCVPKIGEMVTDDAASYKYLVESIRMHPNQDNLKALITSQGFEDCRYINLSGGIVAIHIAYKY